jgi:hypothetical protein
MSIPVRICDLSDLHSIGPRRLYWRPSLCPAGQMGQQASGRRKHLPMSCPRIMKLDAMRKVCAIGQTSPRVRTDNLVRVQDPKSRF